MMTLSSSSSSSLSCSWYSRYTVRVQPVSNKILKQVSTVHSKTLQSDTIAARSPRGRWRGMRDECTSPLHLHQGSRGLLARPSTLPSASYLDNSVRTSRPQGHHHLDLSRHAKSGKNLQMCSFCLGKISAHKEGVIVPQKKGWKRLKSAWAPQISVEAKLYYTSSLDGVWIKIKKVWINPNNSHDSLDRSKIRPSQAPTNHPSEFFGHITFSVPSIKL